MKVSVLGATGYAGAELLRILYNHPQAEVVHITSESHTGEKIADLYPHLRGCYDMVLESMKDIEAIGKDSDFVFIGLPHGHAMKVGRALRDLPVRIIDLGADYRFRDTSVYEAWYHVPHTDPEAERVYGLAELYRDEIRDAKIIGNAGCFTTASILALAPLARAHLIDVNTIIVTRSQASRARAARRSRPTTSRSSTTISAPTMSRITATRRRLSRPSRISRARRRLSTSRRTSCRCRAASSRRATRRSRRA